MSDVERDGDQFVVDARVLAKAFDLSLEETRARMRDGLIASSCESGEGEDAGRWRLTFRHQGHVLRLVVDSHGEILSRSTYPVGHSSAPARTRSQAILAEPAPARRRGT
jgi:hypothetical protein